MADVIAHFEITFDRDESFYKEGDTITGEVVVDLKEDMVIELLTIEFSGKASVKLGNNKVVFRRQAADPQNVDEEHYLNQCFCLYSRAINGSEQMVVSAGHHVYPFLVQLPNNLPSSHATLHGTIEYRAKAILVRPWQPREVTKKSFSVTSVVSLAALPGSMQPLHCRKSKQVGLSCCPSGTVSVLWRLDRMGYLCGDKVRINGEIENNSRTRVAMSYAALVQHIRYFRRSGSSLHERKRIAVVQKGEVLPGHIGFWREELEVPSTLPTGLKGCRLMDLWYTLNLSVVFAGLAAPLETTTDIIIATTQDGGGVDEDAVAVGSPPDYHPYIHTALPCSNPAVDTDIPLEVTYFT
ncbi:Arrestin domain-containing protein 1 [Lamellibrachia satsuma]|nr:Arrestin domain-containing protein 1 [Lamellibrachia satsuma]